MYESFCRASSPEKYHVLYLNLSGLGT